MARPRKYTKKYLKELAVEFEEYIRYTDIPIIAEFAVSKGLPKQFMYDYEEFSDLLKICTSKKESALERGTLEGNLNPTMAVFSLKQLGWSDKQEVEHSGEMKQNINHMANLTEGELRKLADMEGE